jgi:CubicO group peptidase (beta-lactamase class C family)
LSFESLTNAVDKAVRNHVCPGGVVSVGHHGQVVFAHPFGHTQSTPELGAPVTENTVYDIASLTKPLCAAIAMKLIERGLIEFSTHLKQLLGHASGLPAHSRFYDRLRTGDWAGAVDPHDGIIKMAAETPLESPPGTVARYSDLGYIVLGGLLEKAGARLDGLLADCVTRPLRMDQTRYVDLSTRKRFTFDAGTVAPTEVCPDRGLLIGEVHDENAHAAGGICGHAGVFSTAGDLSRFASAMLSKKNTAFDRNIVDAFFTESAAPNTTWRLGWDTPSVKPGESSAGDLWPRDSIGHLGFTGTSLWLHPRTESFVVLLTNRVHPTRDREGIRDLRRAVMDEAAKALSLV